MKFLRRKARGTETVRDEGMVVHREIEITVERELVSMAAFSGPPGHGVAPRCSCCGQTIPVLDALCSHQPETLTLAPPPQRGDE